MGWRRYQRGGSEIIFEPFFVNSHGSTLSCLVWSFHRLGTPSAPAHPTGQTVGQPWLWAGATQFCRFLFLCWSLGLQQKDIHASSTERCQICSLGKGNTCVSYEHVQGVEDLLKLAQAVVAPGKCFKKARLIFGRPHTVSSDPPSASPSLWTPPEPHMAGC